MLNCACQRTRSRTRGGGVYVPSLNLNFAVTKALDPRITFTRASTATYYDGTTATAEENRIFWSQSFSAWPKNDMSVTANVSAAPDGTQTASNAVPTTNNATHQIQSGTSLTSALSADAVGTFSVFAKANGYNWIRVQLSTAAANPSAYFNVSTGTLGTVNSPTNGATVLSTSITPAGNGWYRCTVTASPNAGGNFQQGILVVTSADNTSSFAGDGTSGVLIWGAQLEQRSSATAYLPTTGAARTNTIPKLVSAASGVARFDHRFTTTITGMNLYLYSAGDTGTVGVVGGGGVLPTNWSVVASAGLSVEVLATKIDPELGGVRLKISGTANQSTTFRLQCSSSFESVVGQTYTGSEYARITAGTSPTALGILGVNFATTTPIVAAATLSSARIVVTGVSSGPTLRNEVRFTTVNATAYDFTIEVAAAQLETGPTATTYLRTGQSPVATSATSGPESLGLLVEEQRANLLLRSEELDNASWTKSRATIIANATVSPDGTVDADKLVDDSQSGTHRVYQSITKAASAITYTASCYFKAAELGYAHIRVSELAETNPAGAVINLATGQAIGTYGSFSSMSAVSTAAGNGWWRLAFTFTTLTDTTLTFYVATATSGSLSAPSYVGNESGLYIWGAQLEAGAFATSYIPTTGSQATRIADSASMTGTNFSSWYRADEGTFALNGAFNAATPSGGNFRLACIDDGTVNNRSPFIFTTTTTIQSSVRTGGVDQAVLSFNVSPAPGVRYKVATAYRQNDFASSVNAASVVTDTAGTVPVVTQLIIGSSAGSNDRANGTIARLAYYPRRLSNQQLQLLTV